MTAKLPVADVPRCSQIRCKSMLVYGEAFRDDPEFQAGNVDFWCLATGQFQGPDGGEVELTACSAAERSCYQPN